MKIYQVDAFTDVLFRGNPAAICPLEETWLPDDLMQNIAAENNLSETAFYLSRQGRFEIRWFTPKGEVDLCGHATLAAAHVLFAHEGYSGKGIVFSSRSGNLQVSNDDGYYTLDFPKDNIHEIEGSKELEDCFNYKPIEIYRGKTDYMFIFEKEDHIRAIEPNFENIKKLDARGIIVTAQGERFDFVSRFFAPKHGINEDPVTGSAHTTLVPYWKQRLNKVKFKALQLSERQGILLCEEAGNRVKIAGKAKTYMIGDILI